MKLDFVRKFAFHMFESWDRCVSALINLLGVVHKWRHLFRGEEVKDFCDNSTKASVIKSVMIGEGGSKHVQSCVTSFMDDPLDA